jgi:hypothetical protein
MELQALSPAAPRYVHRPIEQVLVRANSTLFYSVATAALLEAVAPVYAQRLDYFLRSDQPLHRWVVNRWLPQKAARAKALAQYVQETWPEFDWHTAYEQYRAHVEGEGGLGPRRPTLARELLARCVAASQSGVFYACLARWADDPRLRAMARGMAHEEALAFRRFRAAHDRNARAERLGFATAWQTALACVRTSRDTHLPVVYRAIEAQCSGQMPFPVMRHGEFVRRMRSVIERFCEFGATEKLLFNPWKKKRRMLGIEEKQQQRHPEWFKPMFTRAV